MGSNNRLIKDSKKIRLNSDDLPLGHKFKINSMTTVIKTVVKKNNVFYSQIALNICTYEI